MFIINDNENALRQIDKVQYYLIKNKINECGSN